MGLKHVSNKQPVGDILVEALKEIIASKDYTSEESEIMLKKALNVIGLAMAGYTSPTSQQDMGKVRRIIEDE